MWKKPIKGRSTKVNDMRLEKHTRNRGKNREVLSGKNHCQIVHGSRTELKKGNPE